MNSLYISRVSPSEYIGWRKQTWRTETSKYPEEKKSIETPLVVASENGIGQQLSLDNSNSLEKLTTEGDSPVKVMLILSS